MAARGSRLGRPRQQHGGDGAKLRGLADARLARTGAAIRLISGMRSRCKKAPGASRLARKAQRAPERSVRRVREHRSVAATPQSPPLRLLPEWDPATEDPRRARRIAPGRPQDA